MLRQNKSSISGFQAFMNHIGLSFPVPLGSLSVPLLFFLWSAAIPSSDAKNANLYFLDVVQQANSIFHLFDKQFNDQLMPLIRSVLGQSFKSLVFHSVQLLH